MGDAQAPVKYMDRTRHYYRALGYTQDYTWVTFDNVPFDSSNGKSDGLRRLRETLTASRGLCGRSLEDRYFN
jgi:hypothetical protein